MAQREDVYDLNSPLDSRFSSTPMLQSIGSIKISLFYCLVTLVQFSRVSFVRFRWQNPLILFNRFRHGCLCSFLLKISHFCCSLLTKLHLDFVHLLLYLFTVWPELDCLCWISRKSLSFWCVILIVSLLLIYATGNWVLICVLCEKFYHFNDASRSCTSSGMDPYTVSCVIRVGSAQFLLQVPELITTG